MGSFCLVILLHFRNSLSSYNLKRVSDDSILHFPCQSDAFVKMSLERLLLHYRDQIKNEMDRACRTYEEEDGAYSILGGNPDGKRYLGRPERKLEVNNKMDLQEVG